MLHDVLTNTKRFVSLFSQAVDDHLPKRTNQPSEEEAQSGEYILMQQRKANLELAEPGKQIGGIEHGIPPELTRC